MIPGIRDIREYFPDLRRAAVPDTRARNIYFRSSKFNLDHTTLTVSNTQTRTTDEPQRIRSVQVGTVSGGTVTVQVQIEGRDIFDDTQRPVSGGAVCYPTNVYNFPANSVISTIIEATSGAPTGTAHVNFEMEPFILVPRTPQVEPHGAARKRPSTRAAIKQFNATGSLVPAIVTQRVVGTPSPRVLPIGEPLGYRPREVTP